MRYISIDVGIVNIGYAIFELDKTLKYLHSGYLCTKHKKDTKNKLEIIYNFFNDIIEKQDLQTLIYEQPIFNRGIRGAEVIKAEGVLLLLAGLHNLECFSYTAPNVKKTIAKDGKADKKQVENAVCDFLKLKLSFKTDHESDAVAIGITHYLQNNVKNLQ